MAGQSYPSAADTDPGAAAEDADKTQPKGDDDKAKGKDWEKLHARGLKIFKLSAERESDNRAAYLDDIRFGRLGGKEQWPQAVVADREARGLPCLTINMMPSFIHQVINDTRQNKPAITVRPVDSGADRHTAQVLAGMIRHIENISNAEAAYDTLVDNSASGGFGYVRAVIDWTHDDSFDKEIYIRRIPDPLVVYGDPYSMAVDSSDWNDAFVLDWMPDEDFEDKWPDAKKVSFSAESMVASWKREGETLVAEWWHRDETVREIVQLSNGWVIDADVYDDEKDLFDGQGLTEKGRRETKSWNVCQYTMSGAEILDEDEYPGRYIPIVPCYGEEVVVEGKRHLRSLIRDAKDPARNFNYWRSKAAETAALSVRETWIGPEKAFTGDYANRWESANSRHWPFLAYPDDTATPPQKVSVNGVDPSAMQQAASAADDMNRTIGIYQAGLGAPSNETSGRAINARKMEGDVGTLHFGDNLSRAIGWLGNVLLDLMPHVYTPGRIVRVLGIDGSENFATLGEKKPQRPPVPAPQGPAAPSGAGLGMPGMPPQVPSPMPQGLPPMPGAAPGPMPAGAMPGLPQGPMPPDPAAGMPAIQPAPMPQQPTPTATPQPGQPLDGTPDFGAIYDIGLGKYDIVVRAGPGYTTKRQEAADQMMQMVQSNPSLGPIIGDLIAENLDWPGADEIARRLRKLLPPQLQQDPDTPGLPPQLLAQIQKGQQIIQQLTQALQQCQADLRAAKADQSADMADAQIRQLSVQVDWFNAQTQRLKAETERVEAIVGAVQGSAGVPGAPRAPGSNVMRQMVGNPMQQSGMF